MEWAGPITNTVGWAAWLRCFSLLKTDVTETQATGSRFCCWIFLEFPYTRDWGCHGETTLTASASWSYPPKASSPHTRTGHAVSQPLGKFSDSHSCDEKWDPRLRGVTEALLPNFLYSSRAGSEKVPLNIITADVSGFDSTLWRTPRRVEWSVCLSISKCLQTDLPGGDRLLDGGIKFPSVLF